MLKHTLSDNNGLLLQIQTLKMNEFLKGNTIAPQLGFAGEIYEDNYQYNQKVRNTSGAILLGKLGFEIGKEKLSFGANLLLPITQNITGGNVEAKYRFSLNLNYSL